MLGLRWPFCEGRVNGRIMALGEPRGDRGSWEKLARKQWPFQGQIFFTLFSLLHWFTQNPGPSPYSAYIHTIVPHSQGCRTNILYTVPLTAVGSLRALAPVFSSPYICTIATHSQGYRTWMSIS
jgi:hypothetical protein